MSQVGASLRSLKKNAYASFASQAWVALVGVAVVPFQIRWLGPEAFGLIGVLGVLESLSQIVEMTIAVSANREISRSSRDRVADVAASFEVLYLVLALLPVAALLGAFALSVPERFRTTLPLSLVIQASVLACAAACVRMLVSYHRSVHQGLLLHQRLAVVTAIAATLRFVGGAILLVGFSLDLRVFMAWNLIAACVELAVLRAGSLRRCPGWKIPDRSTIFKSLSPTSSFVTKMGGLAVLSFLINQADRFLLPAFASLEEIGHYMFAKTLAGGLVLFATPVFSAAMPSFSRAHSDGDWAGISESYHALSRTVTAVAAPVAFFAIAFAPELLVMLGGASSASAMQSMRILTAGFLLYVLQNVPFSLQLASGESSVPLVVNAFGLPLVWGVTILSIPFFGVVGAAIGFLALNILGVVLGPILMHRRILAGEWSQWALLDVAPGVGVGALAALIGLAMAGPFDSSFARIVFGALFAAIASFGLLYRANRPLPAGITA